MYVVTRLWVSFLLRVFFMKPWTSSMRPVTLHPCSLYLPPSQGCCLFQWPGGSLFAGTGLNGSSWCRARRNGSSLWRPSDVVHVSRSGSVQWLRTCVFLFTKGRGDKSKVHHSTWFTDYNRLLDVEASGNKFLHMPSSSTRDRVDQVDKLVQGIFQKERGGVYCDGEIDVKSDCVDRKDGEKLKITCRSTSNLLNESIQGKNNRWKARRQAALYYWSGWLASLMDFEDSFQHSMYNSKVWGRYLLNE